MHPSMLKRQASFDVPSIVLRTAQSLEKRRRQSSAAHVLYHNAQRPGSPSSYEAESTGARQRVLRTWVKAHEPLA